MRPSHPFLILPLPFLLLLAAAVAAGNSKQCHSDDKAALLAIKEAFNNAYHFASWTPDTPCCEWYDIDCDVSTGRVVGLSVFQDDNVTGPVPPAIAKLTQLRTLMLHHLPAVSGPIPSALSKLSKLQQLTISWTAVSGPVPAFLGGLTALTSLDLSFNSLTGSIPPSLAALPNLFAIDLSRNHLAGTLPPALLSKSPQEAYLQLSHNNLSGSIPAEFAAVKFTRIDLSRNQFTGDASVLLGKAKTVQIMDLSRNAFQFDLSGVEFPEGLNYIDMSHNMIYGSIPAQLASLASLRQFNVSYNRLCGEVPSGGNVANFDLYNFAQNKCLCGSPLPPCH